jgi:gluconate 2-dehydrogenase gamma chain
MNRRDLLKFSVTAAAAPAALGAAQTQHQHGAAAAPAKTQQNWQPRLFDEHQNATVIVLTELIIPATDTPGAKDAKVNEWLDLLLSEGPVEERDSFLSGIAWLDGYSIRQHRRPFVKLNPQQQTAILQTLDTGSDPATEPGKRFFSQAKRWTSRIYFLTEAGYKELNKHGSPASYASCS